MGRHPEVSTKIAILLKRQKGKCAHCGLNFRENDVLEVDHIKPKSIGGKNEYSNLQLLHLHCHDIKTREDIKEIRKHQRTIHGEMFSQINWKWVNDVLVCI